MHAREKNLAQTRKMKKKMKNANYIQELRETATKQGTADEGRRA